MERLERHYRDVQDIEFTIEDGRLYLLQTRSAKRTAAAAVKSAVAMVGERLITRAEAIRRIDPAQLDQLLHPMLDPGMKLDVASTGLNASPGAACGVVVLDADTAEQRGKAGESVILVRSETAAADIHGLIQSAGIVTAFGGITSHAAVVARGMGKPCVAGVEDLVIDLERRTASFGGHVIAEGDAITIDGTAGLVMLGRLELVPPRINADFQTLLTWADGFRHLGVHANADTPADAAQGARARRRRDRPLPHRAHVHGRGPAAGRARDDHGRRRARAPCRPRQAAADAAVGLRGHLRRPWPACR